MELTLNHDIAAEDKELMEGILHRIPEALDRLHQRYRTVLRSIIKQVLYDDAETDDVLQDVLLQVWNRAESYSSGKGKLVSWLGTLARRRAIDRLRQHSAYQRATDRYEVSCHQAMGFEDTHIVERDACRHDLRELLTQFINELPPNQQEVIRLAYFEDRSQREISALTKTPLGTVKTRLELGMKKLAHSVGGLKDKVR